MMLRLEMVKDKALKEKLIHGSFPHAITLPRKIAVDRYIHVCIL